MMFKICLDTNNYRDEHEKNDDTEMNGNWIERMNGMNGWTGWTDERDERMNGWNERTGGMVMQVVVIWNTFPKAFL